MKPLMLLYTIYFSFLMIVPCNHTDLYAYMVQHVLGIDSHHHCHHSHPSHHDDTQPSKEHQHHGCTPFCACGAVHFVMVAPTIYRWFCASAENFFKPVFFAESTKVWTNSNQFGRLVIAEIWHPPHF